MRLFNVWLLCVLVHTAWIGVSGVNVLLVSDQPEVGGTDVFVVDILTAAGHVVTRQPTGYLQSTTTLSTDQLTYIYQFDLIVVGKVSSPTLYAAPASWNSITIPIVILHSNTPYYWDMYSVAGSSKLWQAILARPGVNSTENTASNCIWTGLGISSSNLVLQVSTVSVDPPKVENLETTLGEVLAVGNETGGPYVVRWRTGTQYYTGSTYSAPAERIHALVSTLYSDTLNSVGIDYLLNVIQTALGVDLCPSSTGGSSTTGSGAASDTGSTASSATSTTGATETTTTTATTGDSTATGTTGTTTATTTTGTGSSGSIFSAGNSIMSNRAYGILVSFVVLCTLLFVK